MKTIKFNELSELAMSIDELLVTDDYISMKDYRIYVKALSFYSNLLSDALADGNADRKVFVVPTITKSKGRLVFK